ncbi:MAG: hypothetical protein J5654_02475 [Victivallales bacterium]|nr:hypothetical protein [Victivallales bacterium]
MSWSHPKFKQHRVVSTTASEVTPFVWRGRLYAVENFQRHMDFPGQGADYRFHEDGCYIRDIASDIRLCYPWLNHYFTTANVFNGKIVLIGGDYGWDRPWWHIKQLQLMTSDDLTTWSHPVTILEADDRENLFNNAIVFDGERYVLLYETDDPAYAPKFTFRFAVSHDLLHWEKLPEEYLYGRGKYVGGPALYFHGGYYYLLYLAETFGKYGFWDTRVARSKDLRAWEDAPDGRSFVYPDTNHITNPKLAPEGREVNASDVEMVEFGGQVHIWWCGGNQRGLDDLQHAIYNGSRQQLLEAFFD